MIATSALPGDALPGTIAKGIPSCFRTAPVRPASGRFRPEAHRPVRAVGDVEREVVLAAGKEPARHDRLLIAQADQNRLIPEGRGLEPVAVEPRREAVDPLILAHEFEQPFAVNLLGVIH